MTEQYLGFNQQFESDIRDGSKTKTLRYKLGDRTPNIGDTLQAVISHDDGAFAIIRVTDVYEMTVEEVINTNFDKHQNYDSLEHFRSRMSEYYDPTEFDIDTTLTMVEFEVVEIID